jgi:hypothetical protein
MTLTRPTITVDDDPEALLALSLAEGWGDGAPLIPPTDDRVLAMLAATPLAPDHVLGALPPRHGAASVELLAINAVMAGCEPRAFPLVLAAIEAILRPEWNAVAITTTTSSVFPVVLVNGPTRAALGIDHQAGCFGGAAGRGSMTIGRAVSLCLRNVGGQRVGATSRSVFGQAARFGQCLGERRRESRRGRTPPCAAPSTRPARSCAATVPTSCCSRAMAAASRSAWSWARPRARPAHA